MLCPSCGKTIDDKAKFCPHCGTAASVLSAMQELDEVVIPTAPTPAFAAAQAGDDEQPQKGKKKPKREKKSRKQKAAPEASADTAEDEGLLRNIGTAMMTAFLMIELLPYLLRSVIMLTSKNMLSVPISCLCGILGCAAAVGVLTLSSKLRSGRSPLPSSLLFVSLFAAYRVSEPYIFAQAGSGQTTRSMIVYGICAAVALVAAAALSFPLGAVFVNDEQKHGGKFAAAVCALLAFISVSVIETAVFFVPLDTVASFMGAAMIRLLIAAAESAFFTLGAKAIIKSKKTKPAKPAKKGAALIAGGCFAAASIVGLFLSSGAQNVLTTARNDVVYPFIQAEVLLAGGDMTVAVDYFNLAGEHAAAWSALAEGGSYSIPSKYTNDKMLRYLSFLSNNSGLQDYMINELDPEDIGIFAPLMLDYYSSRDNLSEEEEAHRSEVIGLCIGYSEFVNEYPTMSMIEKYSSELSELSAADTAYSKQLRVAEIYSGIQRGETSVGSAISEMLDISEEYPNDIRLQAIAAIVGSENRWDGAGHYARTAEAVLRYIRCIESDPNLSSDGIKLAEAKNGAAEMLIKMKEYNKAVDILSETVKEFPDNKSAKQKLARCYMELGDTDKSLSLAKEMSKTYPDDVTVLWTLCVSALKKGDNTEAINAASLLADAVKNGNLDGDSLLFNCVSYLAMSDGNAGFTYCVYSEDTADEPVKQIMKNEFLNDYCAAVYSEKRSHEYEKALEHVDKALAVQSNSSRLWYLKGLILYNMEEFQKSEEALLKADALDPNDLSIMYALANTYDGMKEYKKAYDYCERVIAKYPNGADHDEDVFGAAPHAEFLKSRLESYVEGGK